MATKKQKRAAAEAKRAEFEARIRDSGLRAQALDRINREANRRKIEEEAKEIHERLLASLTPAKKAVRKKTVLDLQETAEIFKAVALGLPRKDVAISGIVKGTKLGQMGVDAEIRTDD